MAQRTRTTRYLDTYRSPSACFRVAPVTPITPEDRHKDNDTTFKTERGAVDAAYRTGDVTYHPLPDKH